MRTFKLKYFLVLAGLSIASCSKFIEIQPETQQGEINFFKTSNDFEAALFGIYDVYQSNIYRLHLLMFTELNTDNVTSTWTNPTASEQEIIESRITSSNANVGALWTSLYRVIGRSNKVIEELDKANFDPLKISQFKGEAYFLRAVAYFHLVRLFGAVPIVDKTFSSPEQIGKFDDTRREVKSVFDLVIDDLKKSAGFLQGIKNLQKSRISEGAALTVLGEVYLTLNDLGNAYTSLKIVVDMNVYSLDDNYGKLFTNGNNNLSETIWQINYLSGSVGEGNSYSTYFTPASFNMAIFPNKMQGNGLMNPTKNMANTYETGDLRRKYSISDSLLLNNGKKSAERYGLKFVDFTTGIGGDGGVNFIPIRYADVILMFSEVLNLMDKTGEAYPYINSIRKRAGLDDLPSGLNKTEFDNAIVHERRVELFLEGDRWYTLIRKKLAITTMNNYYIQNGQSGFSLESFRLLMPIPQREIDIGTKLSQNPGY